MPVDLTVSLDQTGTPHDPLSPLIGEKVLRRIEVDLPAGIVGDPRGAQECPMAQLSGFTAECPAASQVGTIDVRGFIHTTLPVFLMESDDPQVTARLGFLAVSFTPTTMDIRPRGEDDFGLKTVALPPAAAQISGFTLTIWGVPHAAAHDVDRGAWVFPPGPISVPTTPKTFLSNGTSCESAGDAKLRMDAYDAPGDYATATTPLAQLDDCDSVAMSAEANIQPTTTAADSPTGLDVAISVPQPTVGGERARSHVRDVKLTLPVGLTISPAGAAGLQACSDEQLKLGQDAAAACPAASRLGTVKVNVPLLKAPLEGTVRLRTPKPGELFRLVLLADGPGVRMKIPGVVVPDPATGQLTATFENAPQQPFSNLLVRFDGGAQASLSTPMACGDYTTNGSIAGWSGRSVDVASTFSINAGAQGQPCAPADFAPGLTAGSVQTQAGAYTAFNLNVSRQDGEQLLHRIDARLPEGITANVKSVPLCAAAAGAAGSCGEESRIGSVQTGAGAGSAPVYLPGRVYLTQGYGGAPYGMSIVVPAKVGPFDLGNVVVQARVFVDENTAALRVLSEPIPQILEGVPLRIKDIRIAIDRRDFMLNPTNCGAKGVGAFVTSTAGTVATPVVPFAVNGCSRLDFKPTITAETSGKRWKGSGNSLNVKITQSAGQTNLGEVSVTLPEPVVARLETVNQACQYADWAAGNCASTTRAGNAVAHTPILPEPLTAGVYLVRQADGKGVLPDLRMILRGNGLAIRLLGKVTINKDGQPVATFPAIPDVPISSFEMDLPQGKNALLDSSKSLCGGDDLDMEVRMTGQSGAKYTTDVPVDVTDCPPRVTKTALTKKGDLKVTVTNVGAGKVRVLGNGIRARTRTVKRATTVNVIVKLTKANLERVRDGKRIKVKVRATYTPAGKTKQAKKKGKKRTVTVRSNKRR